MMLYQPYSHSLGKIISFSYHCKSVCVTITRCIGPCVVSLSVPLHRFFLTFLGLFAAEVGSSQQHTHDYVDGQNDDSLCKLALVQRSRGTAHTAGLSGAGIWVFKVMGFKKVTEEPEVVVTALEKVRYLLMSSAKQPSLPASTSIASPIMILKMKCLAEKRGSSPNSSSNSTSTVVRIA